MQFDEDVDVLVVGSGAAGLCAAVVANDMGLHAVIAEKAALFGGTTAYSAGVAWIPASRQALSQGVDDSPERALEYLRKEVGSLLDEPKAQAFVRYAGEAMDYLSRNTHVRYEVALQWPDYHPTLPGGMNGGRSMSPVPFDGRQLGEWFDRLRPPLRSMMAFGGMSVGRDDLKHVYGMRRSSVSLAYMGRLVGRYVLDRFSGWSRGTRLVNGNALVGRLALSAKERGIALWLESPMRELIVEDGRVVGAVLSRQGRLLRIGVRRAVVLASGGQSASGSYQAGYAHVQKGLGHYSVVPDTNTGEGIRAATAVGASLGAAVHHLAAWAPVSLVPMADGSVDRFPHFIDRGKPGFIAISKAGKRFVNEALSYHDFVPRLLEASAGRAQAEAFLVCDQRTLRRFGMGAVPPAPGSIASYLRSGYLMRSDNIESLALKIGVPADAFRATVEEFNRGAQAGTDTQFGRGSDAYQRFNGSSLYRPSNPSLAPVERAPFYAVRLVPGDIGSFSGLRTNTQAQVLRADGSIIQGLYACGNDMTSVMGGTYPGAGITIGPALTFAYLAARAIGLDGQHATG